jgi:hypothetical protein
VRTKEEQMWEDLATTILSAIKSTADRISAIWPYITLVYSEYYNTEIFPLRVYGGFGNSLAPESEEEEIVISVDFRREGKTIEVIADISREQGETFDMTPAVYIPADEGGSISEEKAEEIGETIARYIQDRWELIGKELSKASDS